ncbi:MAG: prepilin peptidase [Acidobacteria bacterium]|nr:prepilin peptidase [Acidobacteriota bacterium]
MMNWPAIVSASTLTLFVLAVSFYDFRERRIPNFLTFPAVFIGLALNLMLAGPGGLLFGLKGLGMGFLLLLIPYIVGGMKAGDVKFLMAIGAFVGPSNAIRSLLATVLCYPLFAAVAVIRERKVALTWLRFRRVFWSFLGFFVPALKLYADRIDSLDDKEIASVRTPFGVAIAVGTLIAYYTNFLR